MLRVIAWVTVLTIELSFIMLISKSIAYLYDFVVNSYCPGLGPAWSRRHQSMESIFAINISKVVKVIRQLQSKIFSNQDINWTKFPKLLNLACYLVFLTLIRYDLRKSRNPANFYVAHNLNFVLIYICGAIISSKYCHQNH